REDIFITTKVRGESKTYEAAMDNFYQELKDLDTDYIDLLLVHCPTPWRFFSKTDEKRPSFYEENIQVWRALEELYDKGLVRAIGVSNFNADDLQHLIENTNIKPVANQTSTKMAIRKTILYLTVKLTTSSLKATHH